MSWRSIDSFNAVPEDLFVDFIVAAEVARLSGQLCELLVLRTNVHTQPPTHLALSSFVDEG